MKRLTKPLFLMVLFLGVSSCPEKDKLPPPTTPPAPDAYLGIDYFSKRGVFPGNAPLSGPGFFFFKMLA